MKRWSVVTGTIFVSCRLGDHVVYRSVTGFAVRWGEWISVVGRGQRKQGYARRLRAYATRRFNTLPSWRHTILTGPRECHPISRICLISIIRVGVYTRKGCERRYDEKNPA